MKAWIARNALGSLRIFTEKPRQDFGIWISRYGISFHVEDSDLSEGINPLWSDKDPIEVELLIKPVEK